MQQQRRRRRRIILAAVLGAAVTAIAGFLALLLLVVSVIIPAAGAKTQLAADCLAPGVGLSITSGGSGTAARGDQLKNAKAIDAATKKAGLSGKASRIAIVTAQGESSLLNLDYGDAGQGVTNADGSATTSFGLFQQQTSQGWGTKAQVMDPAYATTSFLLGPKHDGKGGLVSVEGWETNPNISDIIHRVQRNADPDHYTRFISPADQVIAAAKIDVARAGTREDVFPKATTSPLLADQPQDEATGCTITSGGTSGTVNPGKASDDYPYRSQVPPPGIYNVDPFGYYYGECTSFVAWRINRDAGSTKAPYNYSASRGNFLNGNGEGWRAAWESRGWKVSSTPVPGAVAWWGKNGGPGIGDAGHVAYVQSVTKDGKAIIEEYNNSGYAPPGHRYDMRPQPVEAKDVNAFLYPPPGSSKAEKADTKADYDKAA